MDALFWVALGIILTLAFEKYIPIPQKGGADEIKKQEFTGTNPDGTVQIRDDILNKEFPIQEIKLVLVVREDLKMTKGKIGAQCGHGTLAGVELVTSYANKSSYWKKVLNNWTWEGQKKVCVKVLSE